MNSVKQGQNHGTSLDFAVKIAASRMTVACLGLSLEVGFNIFFSTIFSIPKSRGGRAGLGGGFPRVSHRTGGVSVVRLG